ncbi:hypothetical protein [Streptosporangium sp. NPDC051022]|uniref:hypothetical protein n=1 Tax=Streptosporangium sp. NPDC051022 TaxID=3155752 RepID=UPI00341B82BA
MPADLRSKALGYLRSGAVTVLVADSWERGPRRPYRVLADVVGHRSTHRVTFWIDVREKWTCSCRAEGCAHIAAVQLVTGHATDARPATALVSTRRT